MNRISALSLPQPAVNLQYFFDMIDTTARCRSVNDLIGLTRKIYPVDLEATINDNEIELIRDGFEKDVSAEIGPALSKWLVDRLFTRICEKKNSTCMDLLKNMLSLYKGIALLWVPILRSFCDCVLRSCIQSHYQRIFILSRDGLPFFPIMRNLKRAQRWRGEIRLLELSRQTMGIYDEISRGKSNVSTASISKYVSGYFNSEGAACVDAGCYGSLFKRMRELDHMRHMPAVFFFNTANPFIWGFINKVIEYGNLGGVKVPYDFIWILGDTLEAFPKPYKEVELTNKGSKIGLRARPAYWLVGMSALYFYWILHRHTYRCSDHNNPWQYTVRLNGLYKLMLKDPNSAPCLLPRYIDEWSGIDSFLDSWGHKAVPPQASFV